jgi:integrase
VKRLKPPEIGQLDVFDSGFPGLALRLSYGGRRAWTYHYRINGKLKRLTLGTYPALSLSEAREAWRKAKEARDAGRDPAGDRKRDTGSTAFPDVLEEWFRRDQAGNRSRDAVRRLIDKDTSGWRDRSVTDLGRRDVLDVLDAVVDRGSPVTARRLHSHLHRFFRWCAQRGIIETSPMAELPKPGGQERRRERALSDDELAAVWKAAGEIGWPFGPVIQLLILTGARRQEIGGLRWHEIRVAQNEPPEIALSGERTKNGEPHTIPLSKPARAIIAELPRVTDATECRGSLNRDSLSGFVFTTTGKTPVSGWTRAGNQLRSKLEGVPHFTIHDLRRTVATGLQRQGVSLQVIEAILGHASGSRSGIVGTYQRHSFAEEKAAALEAWGQHVTAMTEAAR